MQSQLFSLTDWMSSQAVPSSWRGQCSKKTLHLTKKYTLLVFHQKNNNVSFSAKKTTLLVFWGTRNQNTAVCQFSHDFHAGFEPNHDHVHGKIEIFFWLKKNEPVSMCFCSCCQRKNLRRQSRHSGSPLTACLVASNKVGCLGWSGRSPCCSLLWIRIALRVGKVRAQVGHCTGSGRLSASARLGGACASRCRSPSSAFR